MSGASVEGSYDGLPQKFVSSMKILFDILDDGETGYILLSDLEKWWDATDGAQFDNRPGIPSDALEALKRITPPNGRLSFERFIAGLKLSLLKVRRQNRIGNSVSMLKKKENTVSGHAQGDSVQNGQYCAYFSEQNLLVKPNTVKDSETTDASNIFFNHRRPRTYSMSRLNEMPATTDAHTMRSPSSSNSDQEKIMTKGDGKDTQQSDQHQVSRRHTLTSGISYNFIPVMKLMQQEKEMLQQGLDAIESARSWYLHQLKALQEKQKNFETASLPSDYSLQANKERVELEKLRITSVNQELKALVSSSGKLLPPHMNLAISELPQAQKHYRNDLEALKRHNQMLTQELGQKAKVIAKLEREKVILVKEMFQAKTSNHGYSSEAITLI